MSLKLVTQDGDVIEKVTDPEQYAQGLKYFRLGYQKHHVIKQCQICGDEQWSMSGDSLGEPQDPPSITIIKLGEFDQPCQVCTRAHYANPNFFAWVIGVRNKIIRDVARKMEDERSRLHQAPVKDQNPTG